MLLRRENARNFGQGPMEYNTTLAISMIKLADRAYLFFFLFFLIHIVFLWHFLVVTRYFATIIVIAININIEGGQHENRTAGQGLEEEDGAEEKRNRGIVV
uniref:Uncharacterized protein n=1 Tax=Pristionchus pacificus TaxID=54126 RepID=A0A2A6CWI7_PRIPA|eukprot:PDM82407.1 hypothetical protein PRIPAC_36800 [Pristionchus pacificus]